MFLERLPIIFLSTNVSSGVQESIRENVSAWQKFPHACHSNIHASPLQSALYKGTNPGITDLVTNKPRISPGHKLHTITWRKCCLGHLRLCKNKHGWMGAILAFCRECLCHSSLGFRLSYSSHISQPQVSCLKCLLQRAHNKSWHLPDQRGNRIYFKVTTLLSCNQNKSRIIK